MRGSLEEQCGLLAHMTSSATEDRALPKSKSKYSAAVRGGSLQVFRPQGRSPLQRLIHIRQGTGTTFTSRLLPPPLLLSRLSQADLSTFSTEVTCHKPGYTGSGQPEWLEKRTATLGDRQVPLPWQVSMVLQLSSLFIFIFLCSKVKTHSGQQRARAIMP